LRRSAIWLVTVVPWLWLCKAIAFDWSSTDNLNELIARDGFFGFGGGGYLYVLLALLSANLVLLARTPPGALALVWRFALTLALVPLGWLLLTHGLEQQVEKYGLVFSGQQFLLGPDREHLVTEWALFYRWSLVQVAGVLVAALGARLALALPATRRSPATGQARE
jgi:hypothetical protein